MTTTTIEQFREQCAKIAERHNPHLGRGYAEDEMSKDIASAIRTLPLPVTPEQAEPVAKYEVKWEKIRSQCLDTDELTSLMQEEIDAHRKNSSTLLARIAELEAENQKLKEGK